MDFTFAVGIVGSLVLVTGAAWPEPKKKTIPVKSIKNWILALGSLVMFLYALLGYLQGGSIFFIFLQILVIISNILMMLDTDDRIDMAVIGLCGTGLIIWSMTMFQGISTVVFILGLIGIGFGNAFQMKTLRRNVFLTMSRSIIAVFSYMQANWIFFWLNIFFSLFAGYHLVKMLMIRKKH